MADDKPKERPLGEILAEIVNSLPKDSPLRVPGSLGAIGSGGPLTASDLEKALQTLVNLSNPQAAAQKRAAETNQVDEAAAEQWFREHWKDRKCPICTEVTWALAPNFAHVPMNQIWRHARPPTFPCVVLTCRVCGYTIFFNAIAMKLLPAGAE